MDAKPLSRVAALAVAMLGALPTAGQGGPPREQYREGLLWRVSKPRVPDSFVFGTIHLADERVASVPRPVIDALAATRTLSMELGSSAVVDARVYDLEELPNGERLEPLIGVKAYEQVKARLAVQAVPESIIGRLKPWAAMIKLARESPGSGNVRSLDEMLFAAARARRMQIEPLEWMEEQIAAFDAIPLDTQVALLVHALEQGDALRASVEPTIEAWLRRDLFALAQVGARAAERFPGMSRHHARLMRHIIYDRTVVMHHRLTLRLRTGGVFVAIGALHLYGTKGLLAMLERDGYRLHRMW